MTERVTPETLVERLRRWADEDTQRSVRATRGLLRAAADTIESLMRERDKAVEARDLAERREDALASIRRAEKWDRV